MKPLRTTISRDIATRAFFLAASLSLFGLPGTVLGAPGTSGASKPVFRDAASQAKEFIAYYHSIRLDAEQQKIYEAALGSVPAPCCSDYPILTCCCPCNAAKATWGLSRYLIAKLGYSAPQVKDTVTRMAPTSSIPADSPAMPASPVAASEPSPKTAAAGWMRRA